MNILTWHAPSQNGAFQKSTELGTFSDTLTTKPTFSFEFTSMEYVEQANRYMIDGVPMTEEQKAECLAVINAHQVGIAWYKQVKLLQFGGAYHAAINAMVGNTDSFEAASWTKQETEARAWTVDNNAITPIIDNLIIGRAMGESKADLVAKIITKSDGYAVAYAQVLGQYHAKQKALEACTTVEAVIAL